MARTTPVVRESICQYCGTGIVLYLGWWSQSEAWWSQYNGGFCQLPTGHWAAHRPLDPLAQSVYDVLHSERSPE